MVPVILRTLRGHQWLGSGVRNPAVFCTLSMVHPASQPAWFTGEGQDGWRRVDARAFQGEEAGGEQGLSKLWGKWRHLLGKS